MFVFRNSELGVKEGDQIHFQVMFKAKPRPHDIESMKFECTYASSDVPVQKGFTAIGIRRVK